MGKRSDFERVERDFYPTPEAAVLPLLPHLRKQTRYIEPCVGDGALIKTLASVGGHAAWYSFDINPQVDAGFNRKDDATTFQLREVRPIADCFITNPPWDRKILHPIIENLSAQLPTWLLFDADWMHTKQSVPYMKWCSRIVSVGRVKWIPDSKMTGKDNCAWYLFDQHAVAQPTEFWPRCET